MRRVSHLIRAIDRLARDRGWTSRRLASELGVDPTLLTHLRRGRRALTLTVLARIAQVFGGDPLVRDLLFLHLAVEIPEEQAATQPGPTLTAMALPEALGRAVRGYVVRFPLAHVAGTSLLLCGNPPILARAVAVLRDALSERAIAASVLPASTPVIRRTEAARLSRIPLLIVERVEFVAEAMAVLLRDRLAHGLPVVLTTARDCGSLPASLAPLSGAFQVITADAPC